MPLRRKYQVEVYQNDFGRLLGRVRNGLTKKPITTWMPLSEAKNRAYALNHPLARGPNGHNLRSGNQ